MRKLSGYLAFLLLFAAFFPAKAQNAAKIIDGLKAELRSNPDAKRTAAIYSDLTWYYSNLSVDSALAYGAKAEREAKKLGDSTLLAQVYSDIGAVYFSKSDFEHSKVNYLTAYKIRKRRNDVKGMAKISNNLANVYLNQQQYQQSMDAFISALQYFESTGDEKNANVAKSNIGLLWTNLGNNKKAIKYLKESIAYSEKNQLADRLCESYLNLGNAYKNLRDTVSALKYYSFSLKNCGLSANAKASAIVYQNMAILKARNKANAQALYQKSVQLNKAVNLSLDQENLKFAVVRRLIKEKQFAAARDTLLQMRKVFEKARSEPNLLLAYQYSIPVYAFLNRPDSVVFYAEKCNTLKEKFVTATTAKQTAELEAKYQTAKKEKQLLVKENELRQKSSLLIGISVFAFFIALIGYLIYRQQKLKNRQQQQEFQLKTAISQIETQNRLQEQRLSISRDLHDNIGAQLTFIISSVDNIKYAFDVQNIRLNDKLKSISEFAKSTIVELRDTIWAMDNNAITFEDLKVRILNFIEKAKMATEDIHFFFEIDPALAQLELSSVAGMNLYRAIQEAVNNAIKYSGAANISIQAKLVGGEIEIVITDDGSGFDLKNQSSGNGLHNMNKRIEDLGGTFSLESQPGGGTSVKLKIPKPEH